MSTNDEASECAPEGPLGYRLQTNNRPDDQPSLPDVDKRATAALAATGQSIWHWSLSDRLRLSTSPATLPRHQRPGAMPSAQPLALAIPDLRRLARARRRLIDNTEDSLDLVVKLESDATRRLRIRGRITARDTAGQPVSATGTWEALPAPLDADHETRVRAHAFAASRDPMLVVDDKWRILESNHAFMTLSGCAPKALGNESLASYLDASALEQAPAALARLSHLQPHEGTLTACDGNEIPVELTLSDFRLDERDHVHYIAALRDISARKRSERELEHLASIDTLTQLPNRATLQYRLRQALEHGPASEPLAILFIDLDGFKHINDSLGHQAGDRLLRVMVKRLRATLRNRDLIARWGGDEFVVVIDIDDDAQLADRIAHRLLEALSQPMVIGGHQISVTASIGIVHAPADGSDSDTLLKHADVAMYAAKDKGKNAIVAYHNQLEHHNLEQMSMLSQLREAITRETLDFVVQPKFDGDNRMIGAELLARWQTEDYGQVPPSTFVPLAEHNGMASALGALAIEHAARYAAMLAATGHPLPVAVNISALHVMDDALGETLSEACRRHDISTDQIELEVTESVFLENTRAPEARIEMLRQAGYRVAMDDFGAGYSSLGYLKRLPFDTIKIDRSFMHDLEADPRSRHLLAGIVGLCNLLGMETVAEGVETEAQWALLQELGITHYQGFYLGRPMPMSQLVALLDK
ncbi:putative bifunctional diguanylate cyclase/phosphodiesterase [Salinicola avicenniae]|uniref:putative bifunctional diguanylate cyclase/phosphodiesterase n=1 Tax=Salinicola avicenniae TaxID=2916836 RepID=UPI002073F2E6|nr:MULTISPECIES: GGDEF and EAL domain-containing protein [unclassified Salinicola]